MFQNKFLRTLPVLFFSICLLCGCSVGGKEIVVTFHLDSGDVFTINDKQCSLSQAKVYLCNYKNLYGTAYGMNLWENENASEDLEQYVKDLTLSQLARVYCMDALAQSKEIALTEAELQNAADAATAYYASLTEEEISYMDASVEMLESMYQDYALAQKLYDSLTGTVNDEVSEDEARVLDLMMIYVEEEGTADTVSEKLASGGDFAALATEYTQKPQIEVQVARGDLSAELEEAAYALDNDEISDCIQTEDGYYFLKCVNKNVEDLTEQNKLVIVQNREKAMFDDVYDEFVEGLDSGFNQKVWDTVLVMDETDMTTDCFFEVYEEYFS
jgi:foldase protein PrsA